MFVISFSPIRITEYQTRTFISKARAWLAQREGENLYVLGQLRPVDNPADAPARTFLARQDDAILAAGVLAADGCLYMSWATSDVVGAVAEHVLKHRWNITAVSAPRHVSQQLCRMLARESRSHVSEVRAERLYQLTQLSFTAPDTGRLEVAHPSNKPQLSGWLESFVEDAGFVGKVVRDPRALDWLIDPRRLYLWKAPEPVAMAAWVAPTMNGGCINYVYVPPEHRGRGYAKAVTSALAAQMLASGLQYCFILADVEDARANRLYQSIGAQTLCEMLYCMISAQAPAAKRTSLADHPDLTVS